MALETLRNRSKDSFQISANTSAYGKPRFDLSQKHTSDSCIEFPKVRHNVGAVVDATMEFSATNYSTYSRTVGQQIYTYSSAYYHVEAEFGYMKMVCSNRSNAEYRSAYPLASKSGRFAILVQRDHITVVITIMNLPPLKRALIRLKYASCLKGDDPVTPIDIQLVREIPYWNSPQHSYMDCANAMMYIFNLVKPKIELMTHRDKVKVLGANNAHRKTWMMMDCGTDLPLAIGLEQSTAPSLVYEAGLSSDEGLLRLDCLMAQFRTPQIGVGSSGNSPRDCIILVETSHHPIDKDLDCTRQTVDFFLKILKPTQKFQVIEFSNQPKLVFPCLVEVNSENVQKARNHVSAMETVVTRPNYSEVLRHTLINELPKVDRSTNIILFGHGCFCFFDHERQLTSLLFDIQAKKVPIFTIGVGCPVNYTLLHWIADATAGRTSVVLNVAQIKSRLTRLWQDICLPPVTNVKVNWQLTTTPSNGLCQESECLDVIALPEQIPAVFYEDIVSTFGLIEPIDIAKLSGQVTLEYEVSGRTEQLVIDVEKNMEQVDPEAGRNMALHRLASQSLHDRLVRKTRDYCGTTDERVQHDLEGKLQALGKSTGILTEYSPMIMTKT